MSAPWLKFYPSDWRADPALRVCSMAARGLWMDMLCIMHEANPRGHLKLNGISLTNKQLAALVGAPLKDVQACLIELEVAGVYSRDNGTIVSRRMVRDTAKAEQDKANGKGGGNPTLKAGVNPPDKPEDKAQKLETRSYSPEPESNSGKKDLSETPEISTASISETVAGLVKRAVKKVDRSSYVWLVPTDTRVPRARQWWRENYGADLQVQHEGTKQGYRVPWVAVQ